MSEYKPVKIAHEKIEPDDGSNPDLSPVIFIHALTQLKDFWKDIPKKVADVTKRAVYSIDARNHGESEWSDEFNFDMVALDLIHFMDTLDIPKAIIVGHTMGGGAAIKAALKHPERFESIVVEDMGVKFIPEDHLETAAAALETFVTAVKEVPSELDEEEARKFMIKYIASKVPKKVEEFHGIEETDFSDAVHIKRAKDGHWTLKANYAVFIKAFKEGKMVTPVTEGSYSGPAAFIYGVGSGLKIDEQEDEIKRFFPNAEFFPIKTVNNYMLDIKSTELNETLLKFLS